MQWMRIDLLKLCNRDNAILSCSATNGHQGSLCWCANIWPAVLLWLQLLLGELLSAAAAVYIHQIFACIGDVTALSDEDLFGVWLETQERMITAKAR
jgi:hypothetical protein